MIAWLQPSALWGLALIALPVLIHLLRARRAPTVPFPSIQFVRASPVAAVRVGPPSDLLLLLLRVAIVGLAVLALAQPLVLSAARLNSWNARVARAIVVDRSDSMTNPAAGGRTALEEALEIASAEAATAAAATRIESTDLGEGLRRAGRWLDEAPPARREVVVLSDFQLGAIGESAIQKLPQGSGLRMIAVGGAAASAKEIAGMRLLSAPGIEARQHSLRISPEGTAATVVAAGDSTQAGLRILGGAAGEEQRLTRAVARAGAPDASADRPIVMRFANAPGAEEIAAVRDRWMFDVMIALEADRALGRLARDLVAVKVTPSDRWTVLLRDRDGHPLLRAAALKGELIVDAATTASSYFAAVALQSVLIAAHGPVGSPEQEVLRIRPETFSAWNRAPSPVTAAVWRQAESSDARWCWIGVLALLGLEQWMRRRRWAAKEELRAAA